MVAKKTIFEKLGLIEPIEEDVIENDNDDFINNLGKRDLPLTKVDDDNEEKSLGIDLLAVKNEVKEEIDEEEIISPKEVENVHQAEEHLQIEDKLDVLIGSYEKNKMLSIDDVYRNSRMESDKKKTIFMVDVFQKTLPENLPIDIKRASVMNIMDVSNIDLEDLLNDAFKRIDALNNVLEDTVKTTEDVLSKNEASIKELESRIKELQKVIMMRQQFQEDQSSVIEYEIQKIIGIVDFIKPKK